MQQAVLSLYPDVSVSYVFKNRSPDKFQFSQVYLLELQSRINNLSLLSLSDPEFNHLKSTCPFFSFDYLEYLKNFKFNPKLVSLSLIDSQIILTVNGLWHETILFEVPLLSLISSTYFDIIDQDWNKDLNLQYENAYQKAIKLIENQVFFSEFGTRRRRNAETQDIVVRAISKASSDSKKSTLIGTSNVYLAMKYNLDCSGTLAHEWIMGISELFGPNGLKNANKNAMDQWLKVYPPENGYFQVVLSDTFTTKAFLKDFSTHYANIFTLRQDSGDPFEFIDWVLDHYTSLNIPVKGKGILFSDSLDVDKAIKIKAKCNEFGIIAKFGIGTHFTNDFMKIDGSKSKAMDIVIKLGTVDNKFVVKLSDNPQGKSQGDPNAVARAKQVFSV